MREIEFRGMHTHMFSCNEHLDGTWVYGYLVDENYINDKRDLGDGEYLGEMLIDPETVGQFTGLLDKNGTKIFEGDIVRQKFYHYRNSFHPVSLGFLDSETLGEGFWIGVVVYIPSVGYVISKVIEVDEYNETTKRVRRKNIVQYKTQVIGNIHENPELLEVEE